MCAKKCTFALAIEEQVLVRTYGGFLKGFAKWAISAAGSEHLPYKQRVGGSNPSSPTLARLWLRSSTE